MASFQLYRDGKSIEQIAKERNISVGTVEGHLSYFVGIGEIDINKVVSPDKITKISSAIDQFGATSHKNAKRKPA